MSSSKKEEERNEKIIRGLLKLPPNRKCINCSSPGPQYVCTNFWTFVCVTCSGIHREFTHRVKSISMAKFTTQEVEALQRGGNQHAREIFLKDWQQITLPDTSNIDKIREFIKNVYVDKKYAGGRSFDKPPRDVQSQMNHDDLRRASSYHAFSQSPPYEGQYEERRYGKQSAKLSRKPGSDRGHYEGKISNFMYSPGRQDDHKFEDKFASETSGSTISDCSDSSKGDLFGSDSLSLKFENAAYTSSPSKQVKDILTENSMPEGLSKYFEKIGDGDTDMVAHSKRTASSGSFGSFDSNSASLISANSDSLIDSIIKPEHPSKVEQLELASTPSAMISSSADAWNNDPFNLLIVQQQNASSSSYTDFFGTSHTLSTTSSEQKTLANPFSESVGWATFDLPEQSASAEIDEGHIPVMFPGESESKGNHNPSLSMCNGSQWLVSFMDDNQHALAAAADTNILSQSWNAFEDPTRNVSQSSYATAQESSEEHIFLHRPPTSIDLYISTNTVELATKESCQELGVDEFAAFSVPSDCSAGSPFPYSVPQFEEGTTQEKKPTNPFDLTFDWHPEASNVHLDMSSLKADLPDPPCSAKVLGDLPETWFSENPIKPYVPSVPHAYIPGQVPSSHFWDTPPQDAVAIGGNPFM